MTPFAVLLTILTALVIVNILLVATILVQTRRRRRSGSQAHVGAGSPTGPAGGGDPDAAEDARLAARIEAFVASVSADAPGPAGPPVVSDPIAPRPEADSGGPPDISSEWPLAELADPATWSHTIREESARVERFGHPVTVVMAELSHLDILADRFGRGVADRVVAETARSLVSGSRAADRIARLGDARFGVLLPETDETAAGSYVERVRAAIDGWLESAGLSTRVSFGWAGPADGGGVIAAAAAAEQRMHEADGRRGPGPDGHVAAALSRSARPRRHR